MKANLFIFLSIIQIIFGKKYKCGNGIIKHSPPFKIGGNNNNNSHKRLLANNNFEPMKIKVDYTQLKIDTKNNEEIFDVIKTSLDLATHYFELLLSVKHYSYNIYSNSYIEDLCSIDNIDKNCSKWFEDYDLILFPSFDPTTNSDDVFASAYPCLLSDFQRRPIAGRIFIQQNFDFNKKNIVIFLQTILFHEITHILIFEPNLLNFFNAIKEEEIDGETKYYIVSPKALEKARFHFGCDSLEGIPLEDQGGEGSIGSHWEGRYMLGDYMVSVSYQENTISDITLALFEDSGWYKVNYYTGGLFRFGKNKGCEFFEKKCLINEKATFSEFCHKSKEPKCLNAHLGTGECYIGLIKDEIIPEKFQYFKKENLGGLFNVNFCPAADSYFESISNNQYYFETNCRYGSSQNLFSHYGEIIGNRSICFESSLLPRYSPQPYKWRSICYKMICDRINKNIIVFINDLNVTCPYQGGIIKKLKGFKGQINCPDYNMVCTSEIWCNEMFDCIDKKSITDKNSYIKNDENIAEL